MKSVGVCQTTMTAALLLSTSRSTASSRFPAGRKTQPEIKGRLFDWSGGDLGEPRIPPRVDPGNLERAD